MALETSVAVRDVRGLRAAARDGGGRIAVKGCLESRQGKRLGTQKPFAAEKDMPEVGMPSNLFGEGAGGAAGSNDQPTDPGWEKRERGVEGECLA